jgi:tetratricopeptide (TPR) repeat protein
MVNETRTREIAQALETFRHVVKTVTNVAKLDAPVPIRIYVLDRRAFSDVRYRDDIIGFFRGTWRANYIVLDGLASDPADTIMHEYVHFIVRNAGDVPYPRWYNEGLAELLAGTTQVRGELLIGTANPERGHIQTLQLKGLPATLEEHASVQLKSSWMSFTDLLAFPGDREPSTDEQLRFYAQSWALVHYLHGRPGSDVSRELTRYIELTAAGAALDAAFQEAFGIPPDALADAVRNYLENSFPILKMKVPTPVEANVRVMEAGEVALRLGQLELVLGRAAEAQRYFEAALAADPKLAQAHAGLGDSLYGQGHQDQALAHYERAIALDPRDPLCELQLGQYYLVHALKARTDEEHQRALVAGRKHLVRSRNLSGELPEVLALYGASFLDESQPAEKGLDALERARELLPGDPAIRLALAKLMWRASRKGEAFEQLHTVLRWAHPGSDVFTRASKLLREWPAREQYEAHLRSACDRLQSPPQTELERSVITVPPKDAGTAAARNNFKDHVRSIVDQHIEELRRCYEDSYQGWPDAEGRLVMRFGVAPSGSVEGVAVSANQTGVDALACCVAEVVRGWSFPPQERGGAAVIEYPFAFHRTEAHDRHESGAALDKH